MASKQISLCLLEKTVFAICTLMLLLQIFLSFKDFQRHDYVETYGEDLLFNVDMPKIILCNQTPFTPPLGDRFFIGIDPDDEMTFVGWTVENVSTQNYLKSKTKVQDISDLLKVAWVANASWGWTDGSVHLTHFFEPMRITFYDGRCFSLVVPKEEVEKNLLGSNRFIMALGLKEDARVKVFFGDPNIYNGYFNPAEEIPVDNNGFFQMFDVGLEQIVQSPNDPRVNCQRYDAIDGFYNCVTKKLEETFMNLIRCVPPWFTDNQEKVCQYKDNQQNVTRHGYGDQMLGKELFYLDPLTQT